MNPHDLAALIFKKKGKNILILDLRNESSLFDYMVISESNVEKHSVSIAQALTAVWKPLRVDGISGEWIVLDYGGIAVHIFAPDYRNKYQLESIWPNAKICDLVL